MNLFGNSVRGNVSGVYITRTDDRQEQYSLSKLFWKSSFNFVSRRRKNVNCYKMLKVWNQIEDGFGNSVSQTLEVLI